jgi:molybdenum cofactor synthesis domain-containing protein
MKEQQQQHSAQQHPMVSVPVALRIVLRETARSWRRRRRIHNSRHQQQQQQRQQQHDDANCMLLPLQELIAGQRLAEDVYMPEYPGVGYPSYRASIMDGYCIQTSDYIQHYGNNNNNNQQHQFLVVDKVHAGDDNDHGKNEQETPTKNNNIPQKEEEEEEDHLPTACYITTGAVVPDAYDCVIPMEEVQVMQQHQSTNSNNTETTRRTIITITSPSTTTISPGQWIRGTGCDIAPGSLVLPKHHILNAISIGLLHQIWSASSRSGSSDDDDAVVVVPIQRRIRVGILSTGNEIYDVKNDATGKNNSASSSLSRKTGKIPDVNRPILLSLLQQDASVWKDCCLAVDLGIVRDDDVELVTDRLRHAIETCDVVITTGGISMGETDIIEHVLVHRLGGRLHFGRLHMKPGKPTTFVTFDDKDDDQQKLAMVFAMPGNPVSATVCTHLLAQPAVRFLFYGPNDDDDDADATAATDTTHDDAFVNDAWLDRVVENATVHVEVQARLTHDVQLDVERPEYHRVRLDYHHTDKAATETTTSTTTAASNNIIAATSTGVQRSSRLLSLLHADGLAVLPQAAVRDDVAAAGTVCTVLLLSNPYGIPATMVGTSRHLNNHTSLLQSTTTISTSIASKPPPLRIEIVQIKPNQGGDENSSSMTSIGTRPAAASGDDDHDNAISDMVQTVLSGSKSGPAVVASYRVYTDKEPNGLYDFIQKIQSTINDVMVIIGPTTETSSSSSSSSTSSLLYHTATANALRQELSKTADALAMQARRGAAAQDPKAALYETVVGYISNDDGNSSCGSSNNGVLVIFLSAFGLKGGLSNVRGLLKHALQIARDSAAHGHHRQQEQHP